MLRTRGLTFLVALAILVTACSSSDKAASVAPTGLLASAKQTLDAAAAVHVEVTGSGFPSDKTYLRSGTGDAAHPDKFKGDLAVHLSGFDVSIPVVSVAGTFYAQLPGGTSYTVIDPSKYGLSDPSHLISTSNGLSSLLTAAQNPKSAGQTREGSEVLEKITATLPGTLVGALLPVADPGAAIRTTFAIDPSSRQLRWAELVGPLYDKGTDTTYRLTTTDYGKAVSITAPATG